MPFALVICSDPERLRAANPEIAPECWHEDQQPGPNFVNSQLFWQLNYPANANHVLVVPRTRAGLNQTHPSNWQELVPHSQAALHGAHWAYCESTVVPTGLRCIKDRNGISGGTTPGMRLPFLGKAKLGGLRDEALNHLKLLLDEHAEHYRRKPVIWLHKDACAFVVRPDGVPGPVLGLLQECLPRVWPGDEAGRVQNMLEDLELEVDVREFAEMT